MPFVDLHDIMSPQDWPASVVMPSWEDLGPNGLVRPQDLIADIQQRLTTRPVVIEGPPDRGKTFLSYLVGRALVDNHQDGGTRVRFARSEGFTLDEFRVEVVQARQRALDTGHSSEAITTLFILDDFDDISSEDQAHVLALCSPPSWTILATARQQVLGDQSRVAAYGATLHLVRPESSVDYRMDIAKSFFDRVACTRPSEEDVSEWVSGIGTNLHTICITLKAWSRYCGELPLVDVGEDAILEFVRKEYGISDLHQARCRLVYVLGKMGTWTSPLTASALNSLGGDLVKAMAGLREDGLVVRAFSFVGPAYFLSDIKSSRWVITAAEEVLGAAPFTDLQIALAFLEAHPDGVFHMVGNLARERATDALLEILSNRELVSALRHALETYAEGRSLRITLHDLSASIPLEQREDVLMKVVPQPAIDRLILELRGEPAYKIRHALRLLRWFYWIPQTFENWSSVDWQRSLGSSTVNSLRLLTYDLRHWDGSDIVATIGRELADVDLSQLLEEDTYSWGHLIRLLKNLAFDAPETVPPFLDRLAGWHFGSAVADAEADDVRWFLYRLLRSQRSDSVGEFVHQNHSSLSDLLKQSAVSERFWILWTVFQANEALAASLASEHLGQSDDQPVTSEEELSLPYLGLLALCGIVDDIELPLVEAVLPSDWQFEYVDSELMALYAVRVLGDGSMWETVHRQWDVADLRSRVAEDISVPQTREVLNEVIARISGE